MEKTLRQHLSEAGAKKTPAKATASRENGKRGGRPSIKAIEAAYNVCVCRATMWPGSRSAAGRMGLDPAACWAYSSRDHAGGIYEPERAYRTLRELEAELAERRR